MNSLFNAARRSVLQPRTRQLLRGGDHGHGHDGPEYGFPISVQKGISFATKLAGFVIFAYIPFAAINHQKAKKQSSD